MYAHQYREKLLKNNRFNKSQGYSIGDNFINSRIIQLLTKHHMNN